MEWQYSGENAYLLLLKNPYCPLRYPSYDSGGTNLVNMNGVVYVSSTYAFPYDSFLNVIRFCSPIQSAFIGLIVDMDTGEGRIYDGTQGIGMAADETIFYSVPQAAIGMVKSFDINISKTLQADNELGQMFPSHIHSAGIFDYTVNLNKVAIDRAKMSAGDKTSPVLEQYSVFGHGIVELDEYVRQLESDYYMCVLYIHDFSNDPENVAQTFVFPCTAFENVKISSASEKVINITATGKPTYMKSAPFDTITSYAHNWAYLDCEPTELLIVDTTDQDIGVGDNSINERFLGQEFTTIGGFNLFAVGIYIDDIDFTPANIILRLFDAPNGILIASSNEIPYGDIITGMTETLFYFLLPPLAPATSYFVGIETTGDSDPGNQYKIQAQSNPGAGLGYVRVCAGWPPPCPYILAVGAEFDVRMKLYGCEP